MITRGYSPVENNSHGGKRLGNGGVAVPAVAAPSKATQSYVGALDAAPPDAEPHDNSPPTSASSSPSPMPAQPPAEKPRRSPEIVPVMAAAAEKPVPAGEVALFAILNILAAAAVWFLWTKTAVRLPPL
jgi:hypothetical protein